MIAPRPCIAGTLLVLIAAACSPSQTTPTEPLATTSAPTASTSPLATAGPTPTLPASPAATAFSPADTSSAGGILTLTTTLGANGTPVAGADVVATITALDNTYRVLVLTGTVPSNAKSVHIGFRFNTEGAGPAPIDLRIYRITYADGGKSKNRLPNAGFDAGLDNWATYGTGRVTTPVSDRGDGRMARIRASAAQWVLINAYGIGVTPGSTFRMTVAAKLPPAGTLTGYASAIFIQKTEINRQSVDLVAPVLPMANLVADAAGTVTLTEALPAGRYSVRIEYAGTSSFQPAILEQAITVR